MLETTLALLPWLIFLLGPVLASFFAAKVMRDAEITKVNSHHSACDHCGHQLAAFDLIPILSFILLRGKCRYCGQKIDKRIFLAEVLGLVIYGVLAWGVLQASVQLTGIETLVYTLVGFSITTLLLYLSIYDGFTYTIPTTTVQIGVVIAVCINLVAVVARMINPNLLGELALGNLDNLLAGVGFGLFFQLIITLTRQKGMGVGDVVVAVILGLMLGWPAVVSAFYVLIFGAAIVGLFVSWKRKKLHGSLLPLVPFMTLGFVVAYVCGSQIFNLLFQI